MEDILAEHGGLARSQFDEPAERPSKPPRARRDPIITPAQKVPRPGVGGPKLGMVGIGRQASAVSTTGIHRTGPSILAYKPNPGAVAKAQNGQSQGSTFSAVPSNTFYASGSSKPSRDADGGSSKASTQYALKANGSPKRTPASSSSRQSQPSSSRQNTAGPSRPARPKFVERTESPLPEALTPESAVAARRRGLQRAAERSSPDATAGFRDGGASDSDTVDIMGRPQSPQSPTPKETPIRVRVARRLNDELDEVETERGKKKAQTAGKKKETEKEGGAATGKGKGKAAVKEDVNAVKAAKGQIDKVRRAKKDGGNCEDAHGIITIDGDDQSNDPDDDPLDSISDRESADCQIITKPKLTLTSLLATPPKSSTKTSSKAKTKAAVIPPTKSKRNSNRVIMSDEEGDDNEPSASGSALPTASPNTRARRKKEKENDDRDSKIIEDLAQSASQETPKKNPSQIKKATQEEIDQEQMLNNIILDMDKQEEADLKEKRIKGKKQNVEKEEQFMQARKEMQEFELRAEGKIKGVLQLGSKDDFDDSIRVTPSAHTPGQLEDLICPFCGGDMPIDADQAFYKLKDELWKISTTPRKSSKSKLRQVDLYKRVDFCNWHDALTTIIPAGEAANYPTNIEFERIPDRLETEWIRTKLEWLAKIPLRSESFKEYVGLIDTNGNGWWKMAQLKNMAIVSARSAGYYGVLGQSIITEHLKNLLEWGYFPTLISTPGEILRIDPLTADEYIANIMVPEAAILLIMDDLDEESIMMKTGSIEQKAELRASAELTWKQSKEYGIWKYKESDEGNQLLEDMQEKKGEMKRKFGKVRREARSEAEARQRIKDATAEGEKVKKRTSDSSVSISNKPAKVRKLPRDDDPIIMSSGSSSSSRSTASSGVPVPVPSKFPSQSAAQNQHRSKSTKFSSPLSTPGKSSVASSSSSSRTNHTSSAVNDEMGDLTLKGTNPSPILRQTATNVPSKQLGKFPSGGRGGNAAQKGFTKTDSQRSHVSECYSEGDMDWSAAMVL